MNSGVYEIVNTANGKRYVGSAKSFAARWRSHRKDLDAGKHCNAHLQRAWRAYGEGAFAFRELLICAPSDLVMYEQIAIDALLPEYNICRVAGSTLGLKMTAEARAKISAAKLGNASTKGQKRDREAVERTAAAHRGMKRSEETRQKIAEKARGRKVPPRTAEHRARMSALHKGRQKSPEHMAALQAGRAAKLLTADECAAISASLKEQWESGARSRARPQEYRDRISRGVGKLTADEVRAIKRERAAGVMGKDLAIKYGVPGSSISEIVLGRTYTWVKD